MNRKLYRADRWGGVKSFVNVLDFEGGEGLGRKIVKVSHVVRACDKVGLPFITKREGANDNAGSHDPQR